MADNAFQRTANNLNGASTTIQMPAITQTRLDAAAAGQAVKVIGDEIKNTNAVADSLKESFREINSIFNELKTASLEFDRNLNSLGASSAIRDAHKELYDFQTDVKAAFDTLKTASGDEQIQTAFLNLSQKVQKFREQLVEVGDTARQFGGPEVTAGLDAMGTSIEKLAVSAKQIAQDVPTSVETVKHLTGSLGDLAKAASDTQRPIAELTQAVAKPNDSGAALFFKEITSEIDQLGKSSKAQEQNVVELHQKLMQLSGIDFKGNEAFQDYAAQSNMAATALNNLKAAISSGDLQDDSSRQMIEHAAEAYMAIANELIVTQTRLVESVQQNGGSNGLLEQIKQMASSTKEFKDDIFNTINTLNNQGQLNLKVGLDTSGINFDNLVGSTNGQTGLAGILGKGSGISNLLGILGGLSGGALSTMGMGNLLNPAGLLKGILDQSVTLGNMEANNSLMDMQFGISNGMNAQAQNAMLNSGYIMATNTHGMINDYQLEKERGTLINQIGGHAAGYFGGNASPGQMASANLNDMAGLAQTGVLYSTAYGVDQGTVNSSLKTFYQDLNLSLTQTQFLMSRIADSAKAANVPFGQQLQMITALAQQYKNYGLGVDNAMNAITNLEGTQFGMNAQNAQIVAQGVGQAVTSGVSQGQAAYMGMAFGGMSDPFQAMMMFNNKWNPDGSPNKNWASQTAGLIDQYDNMMGAMGGGDSYATQWMKYQNFIQMGMSPQVADQLAQTNDPNLIKDILVKNQNQSIQGGAAGAQQSAANDSQTQLAQNIANASNNLSNITKTQNQITTEQQNLAQLVNKVIPDYSGAIHAVGSSISGAFSQFAQQAQGLSEAMGVLTAALIGLSLANGALSFGQKAGGIWGDITKAGKDASKDIKGMSGAEQIAKDESVLTKLGRGGGRFTKLLALGTLGATMFGGFFGNNDANAATLPGGIDPSSMGYDPSMMSDLSGMTYDPTSGSGTGWTMDPTTGVMTGSYGSPSSNGFTQYNDNASLTNTLADTGAIAGIGDLMFGRRFAYGAKSATGMLGALTKPGSPLGLLTKSNMLSKGLLGATKLGGDFFAPFALLSGGVDALGGAYDAYKNPADRRYALRDTLGNAVSDMGFTGLGAAAGLGVFDEVTVPVGMALDGLDHVQNWIFHDGLMSHKLGNAIAGVNQNDVNYFSQNYGMSNNAAMAAAHYYNSFASSGVTRGLNKQDASNYAVQFMNLKNANPGKSDEQIQALLDSQMTTTTVQKQIQDTNSQQLQTLMNTHQVIQSNGQLTKEASQQAQQNYNDFKNRDDKSQAYLDSVEQSIGPNAYQQLKDIYSAQTTLNNNLGQFAGFVYTLQQNGGFTNTNQITSGSTGGTHQTNATAQAVSESGKYITKYQSQLQGVDPNTQSIWSTAVSLAQDNGLSEKDAVAYANKQTSIQLNPYGAMQGAVGEAKKSGKYVKSSNADDEYSALLNDLGKPVDVMPSGALSNYGAPQLDTTGANADANQILDNYATILARANKSSVPQARAKLDAYIKSSGMTNTQFADYLVKKYGKEIYSTNLQQDPNAKVSWSLSHAIFTDSGAANGAGDMFDIQYSSDGTDPNNNTDNGINGTGAVNSVYLKALQNKNNSTPSGSSGGSSNKVSGSSNSDQVWNFFANKGLSPNAIAGIMGNLMQESSLNPKAYNSSSGATGIAQWLGGRLSGLQQYASSNGLNPNDLQTQLNYMWQELQAGGNGSISTLNGENSASAAAQYFEQAYERAGSGAMMQNRVDYANQFLSGFNNGGQFSISGSNAGPTPPSWQNIQTGGTDPNQTLTPAQAQAQALQQAAAYKNSMVKPLNTDLISKSPYSLTSADTLYSAKGAYSGSIAYGDTGFNSQDFSRKAVTGQSQYNIYIQQDPAKASDYYNQFANYLQTQIDKAQKEFAAKYAQSQANN